MVEEEVEEERLEEAGPPARATAQQELLEEGPGGFSLGWFSWRRRAHCRSFLRIRGLASASARERV